VQLISSSVTRCVLPLAVVGLALVGCSTGETGNPSAETKTTTSAANTSEKPTSSSTPASGSSLAAYKPCDELTSVAGPLGLTGIEEDGTQECKARYPSTVAVRVKAFPQLGIKDYVPGASSEISDVPVGSHKAKRVTKPASSTSCAITIEVSSTSRVDVVASANASLDEACEAANKVATAIEPKLPK
jgi:hypothetical protein